MTPDATRTRGAAAGFAIPVGALIMLIALVATPGSWWHGYVSEAGTAAAPWATAYRCGLILLSAGVALLGLALRPASPFLAALLGSAALLAGTSGAVPCTDRCPLPPFEPTTASDVIHTSASILGMAVTTGAMAFLALSSAFRPAMRRLAAASAALTVPLGGALGLTMLIAGRGVLGAILERILLTVAVSWLTGTTLLTVLRNSVRVESWTPPVPTRSSSGSRS